MDREKILIFDMDGVVLDSEPLHQRAREMMYEKYGVKPLDCFPDPVGKSSRLFWETVADICGMAWDSKQMEDEQFSLVAEQVETGRVPVTEGLLEVLGQAKEEGVKAGLATSSDRAMVERVLRALGIIQYFDIIVTGDEVANKKPFPDVYERVLEIAGINPGRAAAVEDSSAGVEAAKSAGIYCYGYRNETSGEQNLEKADRVVGHLRDVGEFCTNSRS